MAVDTINRYDNIFLKSNMNNVFSDQDERIQKCYPFGEN